MKLDEIRRERIAMQRMARVPVRQLLEQLKRETYLMAQENGVDSSLYMTVNGQMVVEIRGRAGVKGFMTTNDVFVNGKAMDRKGFDTFMELASRSKNLTLDVRTAADDMIKNEYLGKLPSKLDEVRRERMELQQKPDCNQHLNTLIGLLKKETYLMAQEAGADTSLYLVLNGDFVIEVEGHAGQKGRYEKNTVYAHGEEYGQKELNVICDVFSMDNDLKIDVKTATDDFIRTQYLQKKDSIILGDFSAEDGLKTAQQVSQRQTVIINAFSASDSGQTCALALTAELKKRGIKAEYVSSYRRELEWDESNLLDGSEESEYTILNEQKRRIDRVYGKAEAIVTDAPLLMGAAYCTSQALKSELVQQHSLYRNFSFYVNGRNERSDPAVKELSEKIHSVLKENNVYCGSYGQDLNEKLINNIYKYVKGVGREQDAPMPAETQSPPTGQVMQQL